MLHTLDWQQILYEQRFWSDRYGDFYDFPEITPGEGRSWYEKLMEEDKERLEQEGVEDIEEGWTISLAFPEGFVWQIDYTTEDEMNEACYHDLYHPVHYPANRYPDGLSIAEESPDDHLPGLRWAELKQIGACLAGHWQGSFDVNAVIPLLFPLVGYISLAELDDVWSTLSAAWQNLRVLNASQADQWLARSLKPYDNGQLLHCYGGIWKPSGDKTYWKGDYWVQEGNEWKTCGERSRRNIREDVSHFSPFFSMLERYT